MPAAQPVTTIEDLLALPDDGMRHELLDGEHVVTPAPAYRHQRVVARLYSALQRSLEGQRDCEVLFSPADIRLGSRTLVQPDVFVINTPTDPETVTWADVGVPLLAVEVLSPSTAARDRGTKRRIYLGAGVEQYWIVDSDARVVERWQSGEERPEIIDDRLDWVLGVGVSGSIDLRSLFA